MKSNAFAGILRGLARAAAAGVLAGVVAGGAACGSGRERVEITLQVHAENTELRHQAVALQTENAFLRAALLGRQPWTGTVQLKHAGGTGGLVAFARVCPRGEAMAGLSGHAGQFVDEIAPLCTAIDRPEGEKVPEGGEVATELDPAGGSGGAAFTRMCRPGSHLVGLRGRAGEAIDAIEPICRDTQATLAAAGSGPKPFATALSLPVIGGGGGEPFDRSCPTGWAMVGVSGRHGKYLTSLSPLCGRLGADAGAPK